MRWKSRRRSGRRCISATACHRGANPVAVAHRTCRRPEGSGSAEHKKPDVRVFADVNELSLRAARPRSERSTTPCEARADVPSCCLAETLRARCTACLRRNFEIRSRGNTCTYSGGMSATCRLTIQTVTTEWRGRHCWITSRVRLATSIRCRLTSRHRTRPPETMNEHVEELLRHRLAALRPDPPRARRRGTYGFSIPGITGAWRADAVGRRRGDAGRSAVTPHTDPASTHSSRQHLRPRGRVEEGKCADTTCSPAFLTQTPTRRPASD